MSAPLSVQRPLIAQNFFARAFTVPVIAIPLDANSNLQALIETFAITVPVAAANSVFMGNPGVTVGAGLELLAGTTSVFIVQQIRQLYELQAPAIQIESGLSCKQVDPAAVPFVVWDLSRIFLVAAANTAITVALFPAMFV